MVPASAVRSALDLLSPSIRDCDIAMFASFAPNCSDLGSWSVSAGWTGPASSRKSTPASSLV